MSAARTGSVKSATRTLDIMEYAVTRTGLFTAQDVADTLHIPLSSMSYLLGTLVEREYLLRDGRRYWRGPAMARLAVGPETISPAERAKPLVRSIRTKLDETTSFFERSGWDVEALVTEASEQALRYAVSQNSRAPLHALAAGKAILAALEPDELAVYFRESAREKITANTITDEAALRREIEQVKKTGIARSREEFSPGIAAIACAAGKDGALSIAIPLARYDDTVEHKAIDLLKAAAATYQSA